MEWNINTAVDHATMRTLLLISLLLMSCITHAQTPEATVRDFYHFYLTDFVSDNHENPLNSAKMQQYVAKETLTRLKAIQDIKEQENGYPLSTSERPGMMREVKCWMSGWVLRMGKNANFATICARKTATGKSTGW